MMSELNKFKRLISGGGGIDEDSLNDGIVISGGGEKFLEDMVLHSFKFEVKAFKLLNSNYKWSLKKKRLKKNRLKKRRLRKQRLYVFNAIND